MLVVRDRVGGSTFTIRDSAFDYTDFGGAYVGPTQRRVAWMAKDLGLQFYRVYDDQKHVLQLRNLRSTFSGVLPEYYRPSTIRWSCSTSTIYAELNPRCSDVPTEAPWKAKKAKEWDTITFREYLEKTWWTGVAVDAGTTLCRVMLTAEPHEVSLLAFLWYIAAAQGLFASSARRTAHKSGSSSAGATTLGTCAGACRRRKRKALVASGSRLAGGRPRRWSNSGDVDRQNVQSEVRHQCLLQAILNRVALEPSLPSLKLHLIQRIPLGCVIKTMTFYRKAFWIEKGPSWQADVQKGPVIFCIDDTKPNGRHPCLVGFIVADNAKDFARFSEEGKKKLVTKHYAETFDVTGLPCSRDERRTVLGMFADGSGVNCVCFGRIRCFWCRTYQMVAFCLHQFMSAKNCKHI